MKKSYIEPKVNVHRLRCDSLLQTISKPEGETTVPDFETTTPEVDENGNPTGDGMND